MQTPEDQRFITGNEICNRTRVFSDEDSLASERLRIFSLHWNARCILGFSVPGCRQQGLLTASFPSLLSGENRWSSSTPSTPQVSPSWSKWREAAPSGQRSCGASQGRQPHAGLTPVQLLRRGKLAKRSELGKGLLNTAELAVGEWGWAKRWGHDHTVSVDAQEKDQRSHVTV